MSERRRVAVTGMGVVSAFGHGIEPLWQACLEGNGVVSPVPEAWHRLSRLRSDVWSPLGNWRRSSPFIGGVEGKRLDPTSQLALHAAEQAVTQAGLTLVSTDAKRHAFRLEEWGAESSGVFLGTGIGGIESILASTASVLLERPRRRLDEALEEIREGDATEAATLAAALDELPVPGVFNPFAITMSMPNAVAVQLALKLGLRGPCRTYACACASGTVALGRAFRALRDGECDTAVAGGVEYLDATYGCVFRGFDAVGALVRGSHPPAVRNRPFDRERTGFLFSQGGCAIVVLEELWAARRRGATVLGELCGYGETCDAHDVMAVDPSGEQIARAVGECLVDAGWDARDVAYVNAHGTGTPSNDEVESRVIADLFGDGAWVSSSKSVLGHTLGASGALEAVVTLESLRRRVAHPNAHLEHPVRDLPFVRRPEILVGARAISQSFAFGGQNAVLAVEAAP